MMSESFDVYSDATALAISDWGANLQFYAGGPMQPDGEGIQQMYLGMVRMSNEHIKVLTYILRRQIRQHESQAQFQFEVPKRTLETFGIVEQDWQEFWAQAGG